MDNKNMIEYGLWGGIPLVVLLCAAAYIFSTADENNTLDRKVSALHNQYGKLYSNNTSWVPAKEAKHTISYSLAAQEMALQKTEATLLGTLPLDFRGTNYNTAAFVLTNTLTEIKNNSERKSVTIPNNLLFAQGIDRDPNIFSLQLTQLHLYNSAMRGMISSASTIASADMGPVYRDTQNRYAIFSCDVVCSGSFESMHTLITDFTNRTDGIGLHTFSLKKSPQRDQLNLMELSMTLTLIVAMQEGWDITNTFVVPATPDHVVTETESETVLPTPPTRPAITPPATTPNIQATPSTRRRSR